MAAGYGMAIKAVAGGINGYFAGEASNDQRAQILDAYGHLTPSPDLQNEYLSGYMKQLQATPGALAYDRMLRQQFGHQDAQAGAAMYREFLPQYAQANMATLRKIDPQFLAGRQQLYGTVSNELGYGTQLNPQLQGEIEQSIRGGQAARGNMLGNANITAEAYAKGSAGQAMQQQRISNMENFLRGPAPEDKFNSLAGGGMAPLMGSVSAASNPGYSYTEGPHDWAGNYMRGAQQEWSNNNSNELAKARAYASAPTEQNPWLSSFLGGLGAIAGTSGGGSSGGGGGMGGMSSMMGGMGGGGGSNVSSMAGYNSMMG